MIASFTLEDQHHGSIDQWLESVLTSVQQKNKLFVELRTESDIDQFTLQEHDGLMRASPNVSGEVPPLVSFSNFEAMEDALDKIVSNKQWHIDNKVLIMFGMPVISTGDNSHSKLSVIVDRIQQSRHGDILNIAFIQGWDMYNDNNAFASRYSRLNIRSSKCYFYLCNTKILEDLKSLMPNCNTIYYSIYPTRLKNVPVAQNHPDFFNSDERYKHRPRTRKTVCLNNSLKKHRESIVNMLDNYEHTDQYTTIRDAGRYLKHEQTLGAIPGGNQAHDFLRHYQDCPPLKYMTDSYTYISTETYESTDAVAYLLRHAKGVEYEDPGSDRIVADDFSEWWTEKTFKAIYYELPFMVVGVKHTLLGLRKLGFETFPEFFDESYDLYDKWEHKEHIYKDNVDKLMSMTHNELYDLYYSDSVQKKLKHNKQLYRQLIQDDPFS